MIDATKLPAVQEHQNKKQEEPDPTEPTRELPLAGVKQNYPLGE